MRERTLTFRLSAVLVGLIPVAPRLIGARRDAGSIDFLWLASRNFWTQISPYSMGSPDCLGDGFPATSTTCLGYLHTYPILVGPFVRFPFETAAMLFFWTNLFFLPIIVLALSRAFELSWIHTAILATIFGASLGTYNTLVNGQAGLLTLLLLIAIPLIVHDSRRGFLVGIVAGFGAFKLSLSAPFVALYLLARPRLGAGVVVTSALAAVFSALWLPGPWIKTFLAPIEVASRVGAWTRARSSGDLPRILSDLNVADSLMLTTGLTIFAITLIAGLWWRSKDFFVSMAGASIVSLLFFPHFPYDYLVLVLTFAFSLSRLTENLGRALATLSGILLVSPQYLLQATGSLPTLGSAQAGAAALAWPMSTTASRLTLMALVVCFCLVWTLGRPSSAVNPRSIGELTPTS